MTWLKRITIIVIILVLLKPAYDFGSEMYEEIKFLLAGPDEEVINVSDDEKPQSAVETNANSMTQQTLNVKPPKQAVTNQKDLTDAIYYYLSNWETEFDITYLGSTADIDHIIQQASEDAAKRNDYINGHLGKRETKYEYTNMKAKIHVSQEYLTNKAQEQVVDKEVAAILSSAKTNHMSDYDKVKFVNDFIVKNTVYGTDTISASPHSAYAALKEGKAVCQGYALLVQKMLVGLGVESKYVVGEVDTGGHAWNLVKVDGQWYHLDTTWNDPLPDRPNTVSYKYFLVNDKIMKLDHVWKQSDYPQATSVKYAYMEDVDQAFQLNGYLYFSNLDDDNKLYRVNVKTGREEKVSENRAQYIVGQGDWLYFSNYSKGAYLTKMKTDGSEETILYREEVRNLFIENGYLYFTTPTGKKKIKI